MQRPHDTVVSIFANGAAADRNKGSDSGIKLPKQDNSSIATVKYPEIDPEITKTSPMSTPQRPPTYPNELTRRRAALASSSVFPKCKSRFFELPYPSNEALADQSIYLWGSNTHNTNSAKVFPRVGVATPEANSSFQRSLFTVQGIDEENDEDVYKSVKVDQPCRKKLNFLVLMEWLLLVSLMSLLITSLIDYNFQTFSIWSLQLWKWCVLFTVILCGRLVTGWFISIPVYLIERNLVFRKKAPYFANALKKSVQVFLWLSFVLLAWVLLFIRGSNRSRKVTKVLHYITTAIAGCLVGAAIWLVKTLIIKTLAISFHVTRFFDRIQESIFHQFVLQTLSGAPFMENAERDARSRNFCQLSSKRMTKDKRLKEETINVERLQHINKEKVSARTMKGLINVIRRTKLSIISNTLDFIGNDGIGEQKKEIKKEWQAKVAAIIIFNNVAKPGYDYIDEDDLLRFMKVEEVNRVFPLFDGYIETGKIKKSDLEKWVINAYMERKSLAHSLDDTKTAVNNLNIIASGVMLIFIAIVWILMMGFVTTKVLVFVASQLLLLAFVVGNTAKTVFEAIIFVFVMHPFDVGDRCVIDGVQMVVEEMNILTTVFLRHDNENITYPNSVLATKPISNFYRSPGMIDSVEFAIDFSTTVESIAALKDRIKLYIESKPQYWSPIHSVQLKDIEDMNKIIMALHITNTTNFQNTAEKNSRRSDLVLELKIIFQELGIRYHLLQQDVHVTYVGSPESASIAQSLPRIVE